MNNRSKTGVRGVPIEGRNESGQFQKGVSGNPGGRPKRTQAEQKAIDMMKEATPEMVELVLKIAGDENASYYARLQAAELILNRSMGKPETYLRVENGEMSREEATASLMALFDAVDDDNESDEDPVVDPSSGLSDDSGEEDADVACG